MEEPRGTCMPWKELTCNSGYTGASTNLESSLIPQPGQIKTQKFSHFVSSFDFAQRQNSVLQFPI